MKTLPSWQKARKAIISCSIVFVLFVFSPLLFSIAGKAIWRGPVEAAGVSFRFPIPWINGAMFGDNTPDVNHYGQGVMLLPYTVFDRSLFRASVTFRRPWGKDEGSQGLAVWTQQTVELREKMGFHAIETREFDRPVRVACIEGLVGWVQADIDCKFEDIPLIVTYSGHVSEVNAKAEFYGAIASSQLK